MLVFMLYDSRSGSTFLAAKLNRIPKFYVTKESHFVSKVFGFSGKSINALIKELFLERQFRDSIVDKEGLVNKLLNCYNPLDKKLIIETILRFQLNHDISDGDIIIIKHSPWRYFDEINSIWPNTKYIALIRDPRAVFESKKRSITSFGFPMENNPLLAAKKWKNRLVLINGISNIVLVKYENLVKNFDVSLKRIGRYLDVSISEVNLNKIYEVGLSQNHLHQEILSAPKLEYLAKWKVELSVHEVAIIEIFCKSFMSQFGYIDVSIYSLHQRIGLTMKFFCKMIVSVCYRIFQLLKSDEGRIIIKNKMLKGFF